MRERSVGKSREHRVARLAAPFGSGQKVVLEVCIAGKRAQRATRDEAHGRIRIVEQCGDVRRLPAVTGRFARFGEPERPGLDGALCGVTREQHLDGVRNG